jgi:hypothetical protein
MRDNIYILSDDESTPGCTRKVQTLSLRVSKKRLRKHGENIVKRQNKKSHMCKSYLVIYLFW